MAKGISEIIATLMIIIIVSGVGMSIYVYSMGYFTTITSAFGDIVKISTNAARERFAVVDTIIKRSNGTTEVSAAVYNYGKISVTLQMMFLNGTALTVDGPREIHPNGLLWFNGTMPLIIPEGSTCYLRVVSALGNAYETLVVY